MAADATTYTAPAKTATAAPTSKATAAPAGKLTQPLFRVAYFPT